MMDKRLHKLSLKGYALCKNKTGINRNYIILGKKKATRMRVAQTVEKPQFCVRQNWGFSTVCNDTQWYR